MHILFQQSFARGFGTYPLKGAVLQAAIAAAVSCGYRAFDSAQMYGNEADTGAALAASGVARAALCITTKVHPDNYSDGLFQASVEQSLRDLQVSQVDVLLLHWPPIGGDIAGPLALLERAQRAGFAAHIGVSNFTAAMMRQARGLCAGPLVVNQVEFHPLLDQSILLAAAAETGIPLSSFSSVARGEVFKYPVFAAIGAGYGKSPAQVVLRWILQKGVALNTMSTKPDNIRANFEVMDFTLSSVDMARIEAMTAVNYRVVRRENVRWAPEFD